MTTRTHLPKAVIMPAVNRVAGQAVGQWLGAAVIGAGRAHTRSGHRLLGSGHPIVLKQLHNEEWVLLTNETYIKAAKMQHGDRQLQHRVQAAC